MTTRRLSDWVLLSAISVFLWAIASQGFADTQTACGDIYRLRLVHSKAMNTHTVSNPDYAQDMLKRLFAELDEMILTNRNGVEGNANGSLKGILDHVQSATRARGTNGRDVFQNLNGIMDDLSAMDRMIGCEHVARLEMTGAPPRKLRGDRIPSDRDSAGSELSATSVSLSAGALMMLFIAAAGGFHLRKRDRRVRIVCNTPALLRKGKYCTVTHILDINRSGVKVEIASDLAERSWVEIYSSGHRFRGQVVWKNQFFAGVQLKSKISQKTVDDIIARTRMPVVASDLLSAGAGCFAENCQFECPHHHPTSLTSQEHEAHRRGAPVQV